MLTDPEKRLLSTISGERAFKNVEALVSGERVSGSGEEAEGAEKVKGMLAPYVDICELEGFPVTTYVRGRGSLEVVSPEKRTIPCEVNPVSVSGRVEGYLADVGKGRRKDYQKLPGSGEDMIVLASAEGGLTGIALEAQAKKAQALICHFTPKRDDLISIHGVNTHLPVLSISSRSAAWLRELLGKEDGVRVRLESHIKTSPGTSYNVVGTIRGNQFPDEVIYLTAHHDTWFHGANDNLSSIGCLLEIARLFKEHRPKRTIKFIVFGSEESGIELGRDAIYWDRGSYAYSEAHREALEGRDEGEIALCMINAEILGYTPRTDIEVSPDVIPFVEEIRTAFGGHIAVRELASTWDWTFSDHLCFHTLGVPSMFVKPAEDHASAELPDYLTIYHTHKDDLESVSPVALESNSRLLALLALRLDEASTPPYPLENVVEMVRQSMHILPNKAKVAEKLQKALERCRRASARGEKTRLILRLARILNKNIYAFENYQPVNKLARLLEALSHLDEAISKAEAGDMEGVKQALYKIPGVPFSQAYSRYTVEQLHRLVRESSILSRLSIFELDMSEAVVLASA
ncbi:MAG: M28 family peptidase, partial [Dehalococcoidia bacterium]